jgi:EPSP synthase (3-phosphoshikimate 1-carboxyvinyltransferase)/calcineurin-like phosphoesterase family protein
MRVWHFSDLHLDVSPQWQLPLQRPPFDVAVVAGDLITRADRGVKWLLENVPNKQVVYVLGNHEAYGEDIDRTLEKARRLAHGTHVHVLENDFVEIDGVEFAGATMWTDFALFGPDRVAICMEAARNGMNDFRRIRKDNYARRFLPEDALARHEATIAFLRWRAWQAPNRCRVIVTHHRLVRTAASDDPIEAAYSSSLEVEGDDLVVPSGQTLKIRDDFGGHVPKLEDQPWPAFPADLMSIAIVTATQCDGVILMFEKMFESRMFFVDKLIAMGGRIVLCDPHRAIVAGPSRLRGALMTSPDIRAGVAMLLAAVCAEGVSTINNADQIERGYERIDERLNALGARITRVPAR